ncbi:MAG: hypothetical protein KDK72_06800 [Chlamydiia bacterium]|nr:hypothetical protein [Chlamydiia bacterium]
MLTENSAAEFCNKFVDALYFSKSPFLNRGNNNEIEELIDEKAEIIFNTLETEPTREEVLTRKFNAVSSGESKTKEQAVKIFQTESIRVQLGREPEIDVQDPRNPVILLKTMLIGERPKKETINIDQLSLLLSDDSNIRVTSWKHFQKDVEPKPRVGSLKISGKKVVMSGINW